MGVYPRQKELDRRNEMRRERRAAYTTFLRELIETQAILARYAGDIGVGGGETLEAATRRKERYAQVYASLQVLALSGSPIVFSVASECLNKLGSALVGLERVNLCRNAVPESDASISTGIQEFEKAIAKVWMTMRAEEFGQDVRDIDATTFMITPGGLHGN
jgi:hypothetical protein